MISPLQWLRASAAKMKRRKVDDPNAAPKPPLAAVIVVSVSVVGILVLALWYLVQPQPLLVQGEADANRIDIAARVDGRVATRPVRRGEDIAAAQTLVTIDNPELLAKLEEAQAALGVAVADRKRIEVGTRAEVIAARRAALAAAEASERLLHHSRTGSLVGNVRGQRDRVTSSCGNGACRVQSRVCNSIHARDPCSLLAQAQCGCTADPRACTCDQRNFALHAHNLGHEVCFVSAVGNDLRGQLALDQVKAANLTTRFVSSSSDYPTGTVAVSFSSSGGPQYQIHRPVAYDFPSLGPADIDALLTPPPQWIYYGTLQQTSASAYELTMRLLAEAPTARCFYDVNLRVDSYTPDLVRDLAHRCDRFCREILAGLPLARGVLNLARNGLKIADLFDLDLEAGLAAARRSLLGRFVRVRPEIVQSITPADLNIVLQRVEPLAAGERYDLMVATNILVYYDVFEQSLAMANVAKMLKPGGLLLTNSPVFELPATPMRSVGFTDVLYERRDAGRDRVFWYQRQ